VSLLAELHTSPGTMLFTGAGGVGSGFLVQGVLSSFACWKVWAAMQVNPEGQVATLVVVAASAV